MMDSYSVSDIVVGTVMTHQLENHPQLHQATDDIGPTADGHVPPPTFRAVGADLRGVRCRTGDCRERLVIEMEQKSMEGN